MKGVHFDASGDGGGLLSSILATPQLDFLRRGWVPGSSSTLQLKMIFLFISECLLSLKWIKYCTSIKRLSYENISNIMGTKLVKLLLLLPRKDSQCFVMFLF